MVFSLLLSLLQRDDLLRCMLSLLAVKWRDEADEVVEAEGAPTVTIEVEIDESVVGRWSLVVGWLRMLVGRDERLVERTTGFADAALFLEVGEAEDTGTELGAEGFKPPRVLEGLARGDGGASKNERIVLPEAVGSVHETLEFFDVLHKKIVFNC